MPKTGAGKFLRRCPGGLTALPERLFRTFASSYRGSYATRRPRRPSNELISRPPPHPFNLPGAWKFRRGRRRPRLHAGHCSHFQPRVSPMGVMAPHTVPAVHGSKLRLTRIGASTVAHKKGRRQVARSRAPQIGESRRFLLDLEQSGVNNKLRFTMRPAGIGRVRSDSVFRSIPLNRFGATRHVISVARAATSPGSCRLCDPDVHRAAPPG